MHLGALFVVMKPIIVPVNECTWPCMRVVLVVWAMLVMSWAVFRHVRVSNVHTFEPIEDDSCDADPRFSPYGWRKCSPLSEMRVQVIELLQEVGVHGISTVEGSGRTVFRVENILKCSQIVLEISRRAEGRARRNLFSNVIHCDKEKERKTN
jgi:hypothetical protein